MRDRIAKLDHSIVTDTALGPALFDTLRAAQHELGLLQGDRATCPFLRPHILTRSQYESIKQAAETVARAFEKIATAALADNALLNLLNVTAASSHSADCSD